MNAPQVSPLAGFVSLFALLTMIFVSGFAVGFVGGGLWYLLSNTFALLRGVL